MDKSFLMSFALLIWVVSIPITISTAHSKGKSTLAWGLAAFLFGFFALILAIMIPAQKRCPKCAEFVSLEACICRNCHFDFQAAIAQAAIAQVDIAQVDTVGRSNELYTPQQMLWFTAIFFVFLLAAVALFI